ncbi:unnamed protein product [Nippostrongylus brasiliensis]|uniref:ABC transporter domain-containing protein n=1 Tax=Nippostrongylus brasiliensis TaxID=27835 RepID=A0A3P7C4Y5_NIPBR|nr:unnamed protein product [Nippostrongylus brasiliensis]
MKKIVNKEDSCTHVPNHIPNSVAFYGHPEWRTIFFRYGDFNAVKGVTFHVKNGECFGLLGVNGAGKTSTFQMLTGENDITEGDAFVNGWSVKTDWKKAGANLGYCPQFDAVLKEMTGEETLYMFARIRGIPKAEIPEKLRSHV